MDAKKITDYVALGIPDDFPEDIDPKVLERQVYLLIIRQYERPPMALLIDPIDWLITSDLAQVELHQPAHDCEECRKGNERAREFLAENPGRRIALGNVTYTEVWR